MKNSIAKYILDYKFENSKLGLRTTIIGNYFMFVLILVSNAENVFSNPFALFCLVSGTLVLLLNLFYDWRSSTINFIIITAYFFIYLVEVYSVGIPNPLVDYKTYISSGILLEMGLSIVPYIYTATRIFLIIPLITIYVLSTKMKPEYK